MRHCALRRAETVFTEILDPVSFPSASPATSGRLMHMSESVDKRL